jgi:hypothetical protein
MRACTILGLAAVMAAGLLTAACGDRSAKAATPPLPGKAALVVGSWRCTIQGGTDLASDIANPVHKYDATYLPEGDVRISGTVSGEVEQKPATMTYMARANWKLEGEKLRLDYTMRAATKLVVDGEVLDHSMLNKNFIDAESSNPSQKGAAYKLTGVTEDKLDLSGDGQSIACKRVKR